MPENTSRVSIVRCPKCGHLLPELPRYSVYRCGGCGGVLRADQESSVTDNLDNSWEIRSGGSSGRERDEVRVIGVDLARKSPMRSTYPDPTRKSPMRERNLGDFDGGNPNRGNGRRTPVRSRYVDESRRSPMRESNFGGLDGHRKSPLRGRMSVDYDAQSRSSGRSADADGRKSPLRRPAPGNPEEIQARDKVGAWVDHVKGDAGYGNKLVTPTESFSGWLPGEERPDQYQAELNRPNASPRKGRTRSAEDAQVYEGHGNVFGRRRAEVSYDEWVEDSYGRARRHADLRYQDADVFQRPRGRREQLEAERIGFQGMPPGVRHRASFDSYDERPRYNAPVNLQNVAIKQEEILRRYNELGEYIERIGDIPYVQGGRGEFYAEADDYVHGEFVRARRGTVQPRGRHVPGPSSTQIPLRTTHDESHYYHQQFAPRRPVDLAYDPRTENVHHQSHNTQDAKQPPASFYDYKAHPNRQTHGKPKFHDPTPNNLSSNSRTSSDGSSIAYERAKKVLVSQNQQLCHPIAGGAPFLICSKCSLLLRLPGKLRAMKKNQCRLQCGSCHTIVSFSFIKKRSQSSLVANFKPNAINELASKSDDKNAGENQESFDFKNNGYPLPGSDSEPSTELEDPRPNSSDDKILEAVAQTGGKEEKTLPKLPLRPPPGSPLRYHIDYSDMLAANGSLGKETDDPGQDSAVSNKSSLNSDQGFQFQDLSLPSSDGSRAEAVVFVNGQPITPDAVRSAEKLAGTISPGTYWYDKMAGFWGLMGSHCLGIISPYIPEFKAPMRENCSGGDTGVFVNGRELHKNDLDLLSTRGLPRTKHMYYIVDISGRVQDDDTGRFVASLGKLAPNVEKTGRGFGMQPPEMNNI